MATSGDIWAVVTGVGGPILVGGLGMAWRLGRLEQRVSDLGDRVRELTTIVSRRRP